jgi:hypothetical protein
LETPKHFSFDSATAGLVAAVKAMAAVTAEAISAALKIRRLVVIEFLLKQKRSLQSDRIKGVNLLPNRRKINSPCQTSQCGEPGFIINLQIHAAHKPL